MPTFERPTIASSGSRSRGNPPASAALVTNSEATRNTDENGAAHGPQMAQAPQMPQMTQMPQMAQMTQMVLVPRTRLMHE
ncbi:MAG: hypothetical protein R2712_28800 [Vicinamibacterales bacterium]